MHRCTVARSSRPLALLTLLTLFFAALSSVHAQAAVPGFTTAPGYAAEPIGLVADTFAVASDGRFATGSSSAAGALITVYNHADPDGRRVLGTYASPTLRFLGGIAFAGPDTLLVSENGAQDTVLALNLATGAVRPLAPAGSVPNIAQVRVRPRDGAVFAVAANPPGQGAIYRISNGAAYPFATDLGVGYLGGLTFDPAGRLYVADTNDPGFTGLPGRILVLSAAGGLQGSVSLAGGQGSGAYDVARDALGGLAITTGATITRVVGGAVFPLGQFSGDYPFPTDIAMDPSGLVLVNGIFTGAGEIFGIRPVLRARRFPVPRATPNTPGPLAPGARR